MLKLTIPLLIVLLVASVAAWLPAKRTAGTDPCPSYAPIDDRPVLPVVHSSPQVAALALPQLTPANE